MLRKTLLAFAIASALAACGKEPAKGTDKAADKAASASAKADDKKAPALTVAPEDLVTVSSNALASGPVVTGSIQPERKADLRAEVSAIVLQVLKENGEAVKKGDLLVRLDATSLRDSVNSAEEAVRASTQSLEQAVRMLERQKTLRASGMTSAQALEDAEIRRNNAQSDLAAAKARAVSARQQLQRTEVRAPFDGIVSERKASNGDTAQIGKELIKVIDPTSMRFEGSVPADKVGVVKVGQPVQFSINGYPGQSFAGKIRRVDPSANPVTRQVEVLVDFTDKVPRVAGLFAEGRIEAESTAALMVPDMAVVRQGDSTFAWKVKDNKALAKTTLNLGARDARTGNWQVLAGLAEGDKVMRAPSSAFRDGQPVQMAAQKTVASASTPGAAANKGN